jgi:hypothetical protein
VVKARVWSAVIAFAGSALLGVLAGLVWALVAPRAVLQEVSQGTAEVVNAETSAFIAADGWFCVIGAVCGLITGVLGCWLAMRQNKSTVALALIAGAVAGGLVMLWIGDNIGLSTYNHQLGTAANGTIFNSSLALGAKSALVFWPLVTSVVILLRELGVRGAEPPQSESLPPFGTVQDAD